MSFPASTTQVSTEHLDSSTDNPGLARADILQSVTLLNEIIAGQNAANGVAVLDNNGSIPSTRLPQSIEWSGVGNQVIAPAEGVVEVQSILRLSPLFKSQIQALTTATLQTGSLAYCSDISTGTSGVVLWNGSAWKIVSFSGDLT
jgi:hypothetical protein